MNPACRAMAGSHSREDRPLHPPITVDILSQCDNAVAQQTDSPDFSGRANDNPGAVRHPSRTTDR